jgi:hypothetical protein
MTFGDIERVEVVVLSFNGGKIDVRRGLEYSMMSLEDCRSEPFAGASEGNSFLNISSHPLIFISCHYTFLQL